MGGDRGGSPRGTESLREIAEWHLDSRPRQGPDALAERGPLVGQRGQRDGPDWPPNWGRLVSHVAVVRLPQQRPCRKQLSMGGNNATRERAAGGPLAGAGCTGPSGE